MSGESEPASRAEDGQAVPLGGESPVAAGASVRREALAGARAAFRDHKHVAICSTVADDPNGVVRITRYLKAATPQSASAVAELLSATAGELRRIHEDVFPDHQRCIDYWAGRFERADRALREIEDIVDDRQILNGPNCDAIRGAVEAYRNPPASRQDEAGCPSSTERSEDHLNHPPVKA
jgi:hypothetical protein